MKIKILKALHKLKKNLDKAWIQKSNYFLKMLAIWTNNYCFHPKEQFSSNIKKCFEQKEDANDLIYLMYYEPKNHIHNKAMQMWTTK